MDAVAESGRNKRSPGLTNQSDSAWVWRTSGLTRDGTAEHVSRDQIFRRRRDFPCSADHEKDYSQPYRLMPSLLKVMIIHNNILIVFAINWRPVS